MKHELSILIPVYNEVCVSIVERLAMLCRHRTAQQPSFRYEILVADDASPRQENIESNRSINEIAHCRFIENTENRGAAAMRNFLARQSQYQWLLYLDCDMQIIADDFINRYLDGPDCGIVNGGIVIGPPPHGKGKNLRYLYEKRSEEAHDVEHRQRNPYHEFRSTNFLAEHDVMLRCPFDERFKKSGYEDVLFGKSLKAAHISIAHIDNPTVMVDFEDNASYMDKIDRSLRTLCQFKSELRGYSRLISFESGIHLDCVKWVIRLWHRVFGPLERRNLCSRHPVLQVFDLYRIGYFLSLTKKS